MVINYQGQVWTGLRADTSRSVKGFDNWWQMPQGGIFLNEDVEAAALRELFEETGIKSVEVLGRTADWLFYDFPTQIRSEVWNGRYIGQKQIWFAVRFTGDESEIDVNPSQGLEYQREFVLWKWVAIDEISSKVVTFKRDVYIEVVKQFRHYSMAL
ncbi:MAG: RNA pyrophosphohydrolase [Hyphomicrobiaceae bacterium]|nr:RNA pyrophosphohydrolase [Hyphomicrobiaceae bacterium]